MYTIVTGAAGTLGKQVCTTLKSKGHNIIAIDMNQNQAAFQAAKHVFAGIDLTDTTNVACIAKELTQKGFGISGLVNIAGGFVWETLADGAIETWERMWKINTLSAVVSCKIFSPLLQDDHGAIVNIGAGAALKADMGMGAYTAAKSGVHRLTEALAAEVKPKGIRVNAILPSIIDTPQNRADMPDEDFTTWATPDEVANVICFLLSANASSITGALIPVNGRA